MELLCNLTWSYTFAGGVAFALWYVRHLPKLWKQAKKDHAYRQSILTQRAEAKKEQQQMVKELECQVNCAANERVIAPELL